MADAPTPPPAAAATAAKPATPAPQTSTAPESKPSDHAAEPDNEFDAFDAKLRAQKPAEAKPADKPDAPPAKPEPKPEEKVVATPKALREQFEKTKSELQQANTERETLRKRIQEFESKGKDTTVLTEQLAAVQKERDELQGQLRAQRQETSPEFKDKYDKPFNQSADFAKSDVEQLVVTTEDGTTRQATWNDFADIYALPNAKAIERANELFGTGASIALQHRSELRRLDFQRAQALSQEKAQWAERTKVEHAERLKHEEFKASTWQKVNKGLEEKNPDWYGEDPEDKDGNSILTEGRKLVDLAFSNDFQKLSPQQQIVVHAQIRQKAAAFGRMVHRNEQLKSRLTQLEAENKELRESGPGATKRPGGEQPATGDGDWKSELRKELTA